MMEQFRPKAGRGEMLTPEEIREHFPAADRVATLFAYPRRRTGVFVACGIIESRWTGSFSLFPCVKLANMNLYLSYSDKSGRLEQSGPNFHWKFSNIKTLTFPEQLIELANSEYPCHAYLDAPVRREGIQVVASLRI
jgi:hypothetical protein